MARGLEMPPRWAIAAMAVSVAAFVALWVTQPDPVSPPVHPGAAEEVEPTETAPPPPTITLPPDPRLLILGDSYTQGYGAEPPTDGWAFRVIDELGWPALRKGIGGTGYTAATEVNPRTYPQRLQDIADSGEFTPNVVVLQGGLNDSRAGITPLANAVVETVEVARSAWPGVQVVILGVAAPEPLASALTPIDRGLRIGAQRAGVPYISPVRDRWFTGKNSPGYAAEDGSHLNSEGYAYFAQQFLEDFRSLAAPPPVG